jgi:NADPH:quinone reductase-like Zn-dependent oxidoreductase
LSIAVTSGVVMDKHPRYYLADAAAFSWTLSYNFCLYLRRHLMQAVVFSEYGGPEVLQIQDVADPIARSGEVVVAVKAASINGVDHKVRRGDDPYRGRLPHIPGRDFSGIVADVGPDVHEFAIADPVFGVLDRGIEGAYAQKIVSRAAIIARKPDWLSHEDAAAMALTGLTALWSIEDTARLQEGETILIQGGAGGVGGMAIQLAHHRGAKVITTASASNHDYVRSLGADQVIDYQTTDFTTVTEPCDVVFDTVGGEVQARSYEVLKPGGRLVWISSPPAGFKPSRSDIHAERPAVSRDRAHLERLITLLRTKVLVPPPIQQFTLNEVRAAHRISEGRHLRGKLVLTVE